MKISLVSLDASPVAVPDGPALGEEGAHVATLARSLAADGWSVTVHTRRSHVDLPRRLPLADGVRVEHIETVGTPAAHVDELARALRDGWSRDRPDVVHAISWTSGAVAARAAGEVEVPLAFTFHDSSAEDCDRAENGRSLVSAVDHIIATSSRNRRAALGLGAGEPRLSLVPCAVDLDDLPSEPTSWPPRRRGLFRLVCVGGLSTDQGIDDVVRSLADAPCTELLVAGGSDLATTADDADLRRLRDVAADARVADRVRFLGPLPRRYAVALLRSADAVCRCPWDDHLGLAALEAMACGTPVIVTDVGVLPELVAPGETGLVVANGRPEAIAEAVGLMGDEVDRRRMGEAAARFARTRSAAATANTLRALYSAVAERAGIEARSRRRSTAVQSPV